MPTLDLINSERVKVSTISPALLAIHMTNPELGVSKETGDCTKVHVLAEDIISSSAILQEMRESYTSFKDILKSKEPTSLKPWLERYEKSQIRGVRTFVRGIQNDLEAVTNAIKYEWSNGVVEGHVNRVKVKKREMYGRAGFDLLMRKVILSKSG